MNINDYLNIAKDVSNKNFGSINSDFITLGLYKLIQTTKLKDTYGNLRVLKHGDGKLSLSSNFSGGVKEDFTSYVKFTGQEFDVADLDIDKHKFIPSILSNDDRNFITYFSNYVQEIDKFEEIKDQFNDDEIMKAVNILGLKESDKFPFISLVLTDDNLEYNKYNTINYKPTRRINRFEYYSNNSNVASHKFKYFSDDLYLFLADCNYNGLFPLKKNLESISVHTLEKLLEVDGLGYLSSDFDLELFFEQQHKYPQLKDSLLSAVFEKSDFRDILITYFNSAELEDIKTQVKILSQYTLKEESIEDLMINQELNKAMEELIHIVNNKHPEINYEVSTNFIYIAGDDKQEKFSYINELIDDFKLYFTRDVKTSLSSYNDRCLHLNKLGIFNFLDNSIIHYDNNSLYFGQKNQFNTNILISASVRTDDGFHDELNINSFLANPTVGNEKIEEVFDCIFNYAHKNNMVITFNLSIENIVGNVRNDRIINILKSSISKFKDKVPHVKIFGDFSNDIDNKHELMTTYLLKSKLKYDDLPKLQKDFENIIEKMKDSFDIDIEKSLEKHLTLAETHYQKNKI